VVFALGLFVFLLAFQSELLRDAQSFEQNALLFLHFAYHHFLPLPLFQLLLQLLLLELLELLQFVEEVKFSLFVGVDVVHPDAVGLIGILLSHILSLDLVEHVELLHGRRVTLSFSLKERDYYSTLWFMRVITIFLLYFRWSLMSLLNSAFCCWPSSAFFFS
jgi:hypothetical protein